jgi:MFS transporter, PAT family, beta-lactamase induction signal transducer AmpG
MSDALLFKKRTELPALSQHRFLRYFSFSFLYVAQGIPEGMTYFGIPAWMAMNGKSPSEIGAFIGVIGIPWSFKILVAPLMDRFSFLPMGRRRPWVLLGQLGLMASFIAMSMVPDPLNNIAMLMIAGFWVSFFGAFQDVGTDGMVIDIVPIPEQARANGLMWGAKTVGTSLSLVAGTWMINNYGFQPAILMLSIAVCLIMLIPLLLRERPGEKLLPWTKGATTPEVASIQLGSFGRIFKSLFKVFLLPSSLLMGVAFFLFNTGIGLNDAILPVFTIQEAGWTNEGYSKVFSIVNISSGLLGMIAGGFLADRFGKRKMISIYLIAFVAVFVSMVLLKSYWNREFVLTGFMALYYVLYVFISIASFAIGMELCWCRVSATQFTLYMAIANMGRALGASLLGTLKESFGWQYAILTVGLLSLGSLFFIILLRMQKHLDRLDCIEADEVQRDLPRVPVLSVPGIKEKETVV